MNPPLLCVLLTITSGFVSATIAKSININPDAFLNPPEVIRRHGYTAESHTIQTLDGYLLTLHRIPRVGGGQPLLLQHGLFAASNCFLDNDNASLAFLLSDLGYDVWLGNARGNEFSMGHAWYPQDSAKYWNFSWHEMGVFDLPAMISHIADTTQRSGELIYVGHSMGTTMFWVYASMLPAEAAKNVAAMVALAPVAYMTHMTTPLRMLAPWIYDVAFISRFLGSNEFLPTNKIVKMLAGECMSKYTRPICENLIFAVFDFNRDEMDERTTEVVLSHSFASTSTKTVLHYLQEMANQGEFKRYDYGRDGNMREYGQATPPLYVVEDIKVPVYLMYGDNDKLASPIDVQRLLLRLQNAIGMYEVPLKTFNHVDFLFARDAPKLVYQNMTQTIAGYPPKPKVTTTSLPSTFSTEPFV